MSLFNNFIGLFIESAPWLILGFTVAGLMKTLVPQEFLFRHLGNPGFTSVLKAAILGAPLPLCSCGVIPAALGLRKAGASKAATTSFLISTPETGVDSIAISYALLGPLMAVVRPIAAVTSAITAGLLVGQDTNQSQGKPANESDTSSCCASEPTVEHNKPNLSVAQKIKAGLTFSFVDLVEDIAVWLLIGLSMAAVIQTFVPQEFLTQWGDGFMAFVVMALVGVPMYICATASTPIAAGLLFSGVSPGAVLVFMLVGPATNVATVGLVKTELGNRALAAYLGAVVGVGFLFGYGVNQAAKFWQIDFLVQADHAHEIVNSNIAIAAACLLGVVMIRAIGRKLFSKSATSRAIA